MSRWWRRKLARKLAPIRRDLPDIAHCLSDPWAPFIPTAADIERLFRPVRIEEFGATEAELDFFLERGCWPPRPRKR